MAYADQGMSRGRIAAIVIVALLHALLGYAFITGLAYNVIKKAADDLKTFDVEEEPPPPEEEPPPPEDGGEGEEDDEEDDSGPGNSEDAPGHNKGDGKGKGKDKE